MSSGDSVGSLLADIANSINTSIRILSYSDKTHWGDDEHEHLRAVERVLDEAKKDFQELPILVNGQVYYEHDRRHDSLQELRTMLTAFSHHAEDLREWTKTGGPIDPILTRHVKQLQKELHRTQCKAARRIYTSGQEYSARCLGAHIVSRAQRAWARTSRARTGSTDSTAPHQPLDETEYSRQYLAEIVACNQVGTIQRWGEQDVAFICDFCDGHIIWEDLDRMPNSRKEQDAASMRDPTTPKWQAMGQSRSASLEKDIVYAPVAIANHCAPLPGDFIARLVCPFCEQEAYAPRDKDDEQDAWVGDHEFEDLDALHEHLAWQHSPLQNGNGSGNGCVVM